MSADTLVARRELLLAGTDGERRPVLVGIAAPREIAPRTWTCRVVLEGLGEGGRDTLGVDSWQALTVAVGVARQCLSGVLAGGARLYSSDGEQEMTLDELFPQFD